MNLRILLRRRLAAISESGLLVEQSRIAYNNAEQTWRTAYTATGQNSEIYRLRKAIKEIEIQAREQADELAMANKDRGALLSFAVHGANIRNRFLDGMKPKPERNEAITKLGNASAHQGSAIADALLYTSGGFKVRLDPTNFESVYGYSPNYVLQSKGNLKFIRMLD